MLHRPPESHVDAACPLPECRPVLIPTARSFHPLRSPDALAPGTTCALACCAVRLARHGLGQRFIGEAPMTTAEAAVLPETETSAATAKLEGAVPTVQKLRDIGLLPVPEDSRLNNASRSVGSGRRGDRIATFLIWSCGRLGQPSLPTVPKSRKTFRVWHYSPARINSCGMRAAYSSWVPPRRQQSMMARPFGWRSGWRRSFSSRWKKLVSIPAPLS